jgi:hypothetical protein
MAATTRLLLALVAASWLAATNAQTAYTLGQATWYEPVDAGGAWRCQCETRSWQLLTAQRPASCEACARVCHLARWHAMARQLAA